MNLISTSTNEAKHTAAHILAAAVKRLYNNVKIGIGPVTKEGFYYDFDIEGIEVKDLNLEKITKTIEEIIHEDLPMRQEWIRRETAQTILLQMGQIYKAELINSIPDEDISFFWLGNEFLDLCRGPHLQSSGQVKRVYLEDLKEVFWLDDPARPKMIRIYGKLFSSENELQEYLKLQKEEKRHNFITLGVAGDFIFHDKNTNSILWTERGTSLRRRVDDFINTEFKLKKLKKVCTLNEDSSGIFNKYVTSKELSYKALPAGFFTKLKFKEQINDAISLTKSSIHIKYLVDAVELNELISSQLGSVINLLSKISVDNNVEIVSSDINSPYVQVISNFLQRKVVSHNKIVAVTEENTIVHVKTNAKGKFGKQTDIVELMVKREGNAVFDESSKLKEIFTLELKINIDNIDIFLIQKFDEGISFTFKPEQCIIIPIRSQFNEYAKNINEYISSKGIDTYVDQSALSFNNKIRRAEKKKISYIAVVGNKEQSNNSISLRHNGVQVGLLQTDDLIQMIKKELAS